MTWLVWGPLAVEARGSPAAWPWPWPLFRAAHPGLARFRFSLEVATAAQAGQVGPLRKEGARYVGPGFEVTPAEGGYRALVETPVAAMGALAAALVDRSNREPFAVAHAALIAVGGCGVLAAGPSGAGKSTLAARAGRRALGSNAVLLWEERGEVRALSLPLTGRGDAAVGVRAVRLVGAWMPGARPGPSTEAGLVARWSGVLAGAVGAPAPLERAWWLAGRVRARWRGQYLSQTSDGFPGLARPPQEA